jgi:hypothetical protein
MRKCIRLMLPGLLVCGLVFGVKSASAAAGDLDTTFGNHGVAITSFGSTGVIVDSVLVQSDGKILVLVSARHCCFGPA